MKLVRRQCPCGNYFYCKPTSIRKYCLKTASERIKKSIRQMKSGRGKVFEKWNTNLQNAMIDRK